MNDDLARKISVIKKLAKAFGRNLSDDVLIMLARSLNGLSADSVEEEVDRVIQTTTDKFMPTMGEIRNNIIDRGHLDSDEPEVQVVGQQSQKDFLRQFHEEDSYLDEGDAEDEASAI